MATVIIGAGIIGTSTAYYLSESDATDPSSIHLIEPSPELFASASGYAAGFLARDWFTPSLASLGALSFDLHKDLAERNDGARKWGYSPSTGTSLEESVGKRGEDWLLDGASRSVAAKNTDANGHGDDRPAWLKGKGKLDVISQGGTTAQVDPLRLCQFLLQKCVSRGVNLHQPARALSLTRNSNGSPSSIHITTLPGSGSPPGDFTLPCTRLVLAAGAWTPQVYRTLFPTSRVKIPITSLAGHSLLLKVPGWPPKGTSSSPDSDKVRQANRAMDGGSAPQREVEGLGDLDPGTENEHQGFPPCHALFTTDAEGYAPELFTRSPGHIYIAGLNSSSYPLPRLPTERIIDPGAIATLRKTAERLLGAGCVVEREGLCWRPVTRRGTPIVGELNVDGGGDRKVDGVGGSGIFVAAGHGAWGISLSLGTGYVVAGLVEGRKKEDLGADVGRLGLCGG